MSGRDCVPTTNPRQLVLYLVKTLFVASWNDSNAAPRTASRTRFPATTTTFTCRSTDLRFELRDCWPDRQVATIRWRRCATHSRGRSPHVEETKDGRAAVRDVANTQSSAEAGTDCGLPRGSAAAAPHQAPIDPDEDVGPPRVVGRPDARTRRRYFAPAAFGTSLIAPAASRALSAAVTSASGSGVNSPERKSRI